MHKPHIAACLAMLCSLSLAACGGGGGGGGGGGTPTAETPTGGMPDTGMSDTDMSDTDMSDDDMSDNDMSDNDMADNDVSDPDPPPVTPPPVTPPQMTVSPTFGTYGDWNETVEDALASDDYMTCRSGCERFFPLPLEPDEIQSPFDATAAFNPSMDDWAARWTGTVEGHSNSDPYGTGELLNRWSGTAYLEIRSRRPSTVEFWTPDARYHRVEGDPCCRGPTGVPDTRPGFRHGPRDWTATLSTATGRKGYFSGAYFSGQFAAADDGVTPSGAVGHIDGGGHIGVFEVSRPDS